MCGIAGWMGRDGTVPEGALLDRFEAALAHRGPDGAGRYQMGSVALVQTRLAIIDLETGDQPLFADGPGDSRLALVANGEIYNYVELRADMKDVTFATLSDCEPILHLYLRHGLDFTNHMRGMYALALYDPATGRLVLARDPFGIKPLYYAETPQGFAFASEPAALVKAGLVAPEIDTEKRDELLQLQFTTGRDTAFRGIHRVLPGETLVVVDGRIVERRLNAPLPPGRPRPVDEKTALYDLDTMLNEAVGLHQRSDVPYGMFLSGGVDSSVLLAMMSRLNAHPVMAFTAGFSGRAVHDERDHARHVAKAAGADHVEVEFGADDFWSTLPAIAAAMDDPVADYATLPTWKLAARAREAGLKVVLSGEGGDEVFAGYGRYRGAIRPWPFRRAMRAKGVFHGLDGVLRTSSPRWRAGIAAAGALAKGAGARNGNGGWTRLQIAQATDMADWLPHDLLTKLDRCLMAHGVEGRVPFLDARLAAFGFGLPDRMKVRHAHGKWALRRWLETALPASQPFAHKRGFTVPVGEWIAEAGQKLGPLVARQPGIAEACHPDAVRRLFADPGDKARRASWALLFYALWHRANVLGRTGAGDVFTALSET